MAWFNFWRRGIGKKGATSIPASAAVTPIRQSTGGKNRSTGTDTSRDPVVVWGNQWHQIEPTASRAIVVTAQAEARRRGASAYVVATNKRDTFVGLPRKGRVKSGAFLAGQLLSTLGTAKEIRTLEQSAPIKGNPYTAEKIAYLGVVGDKFAFVATIGGLPFADILGDELAIQKAVADFREHLVSGGIFLIQDHAAILASFGQYPQEYDSQARRVDGLPYDSTYAQSLTGLRALGLAPQLKIAGGAVLALGVMVGAYVGYETYLSQSVSEATLARKEAAANRARAEYLKTQQDAVAADGATIARDAAVPVWSFLAKARLDRAGFALTKVDCVNGICNFRYSRDNKVKTFTDYVQTHVKGESPGFDVSKLEEAVTGVPIPKYDEVPKLDLGKVVTDPDLLLRLGTTSQKVALAKVKLLFTPPSPISDPKTESQMRTAEVEALRRLKGSWSYEGPSDTFVAAMQRLPAVATVRSIELIVSPTPAKTTDVVKATGAYYMYQGAGR